MDTEIEKKEILTGKERRLANLRAPWKKGESGNPNGRPRNRVPDILSTCLKKKRKDILESLNSMEVDAIESTVLTLSLGELQAVAKHPDTPTYLKTLALAAIHDMKNGRTKTVDLLRDRQFGAVKKEVDVTTGGQSLAPQGMTPQEAKEMLDEIEKEF